MGGRNVGARYRELGAELRKRREAAGLSGLQVAHRVGWSHSKVHRIENGQSRINPVDAVEYLGACGIWRGQALDLLALCRDAESRLGYWLSPHGEWLEDSLSALIYHESTAAESTMYEPQLVHGLLQTADYARARIAGAVWINPSEIDQAVRIRQWRQGILHTPYPAMFRFFLHEHALRLEVGNAVIMHEQMLQLVLLAALDHITIRVVPSLAGERSAFGGAFRLFEYAKYPPLVYLDNCTTGLFLEDKEFVDPYRKLVPVISEVALDEGQSRRLIAALASEYDRRSERDADRLEEEQL